MITEISILKVIQKQVDLPENVLAKLGKELFDHIDPFLPKIGSTIHPLTEDQDGLSLREWENILVAIQKLKEIHATIEPQYIEDQLYIDNLKQLESKISEIVFKHK